MASNVDPIHIKASHKGLFGAKAKAAGMSTEAYANKERDNPKASPALRKEAVFAHNAETKFNLPHEHTSKHH